MANVNRNKYPIAIALWTIVMIVSRKLFVIPQFDVPHVGRQICDWAKPKVEELRNLKTPPWFALLDDYENTINSGGNLYVWPAGGAEFRLGNRLFNYAATFGIAWQNNRIPIWPKNRGSKHYDIAQFFNLRIPVDRNDTVIPRGATRPLVVAAKGNGIYDEKFEHLPRFNITLASVFASYKYFQHVEHELRVDFTFRPDILDTARRWLEKQTPDEWKHKKFVRVVIHVRRTDYTNPAHERDGWPRPNRQYFSRSMSYFKDCFERVQFVVLSDDPAWCRTHLNVTDNVVFSSGHSPIEDMAIASLCDHAIVTIGTYGWWAAWFANGVTVTQRNLPRINSSLSKRLHRNDHYKPEWIGL